MPPARSRRTAVRTAAALLATAALLAACGDDDPSEGPGTGDPGTAAGDGGELEQRSFEATLDALNGSGTTGRTILSQLGERLRVQVTANGLTPRREHAQRIHALESGGMGSCPTDDDDQNGDGTVSADEALGAAGPAALELEPFPRAGSGGKLSFQGTFELPTALDPLSDGVVVLYGLDRGGSYEPTLPVACGVVEQRAP